MTDFICGLLDMIRDLIANSFPSLSIEPGHLSTVLSSFEMMIKFVAQINFIVPLPTILLVTSLVYGFKVMKFGLFLVNWCIRRLRGG